jgi:tRNA-dihydrouridine synthase B
MQDVTDLACWRLLRRYGGPDAYFTEYFRVYATSVPDPEIAASIVENPTGCPVVAQMIGNDIPALVRTARQLQALPVAGIDFNLGCPPGRVPEVCRGGLLRDLPRVDAILAALREAVQVKLSVKTRVGFDSPARFEELLAVLARHRLDLVTVHGRTVTDGYRSPVRYDLIAQAARHLPCPVLANGNVYSARQALTVLEQTGAHGLMIGRGAIRNPWIFAQLRQAQRGESPWLPRGRDVQAYLHALLEATARPDLSEDAHVQRVKKAPELHWLGHRGERPVPGDRAAGRDAVGARAAVCRLVRSRRTDAPGTAAGAAGRTGCFGGGAPVGLRSSSPYAPLHPASSFRWTPTPGCITFRTWMPVPGVHTHEMSWARVCNKPCANQGAGGQAGEGVPLFPGAT